MKGIRCLGFESCSVSSVSMMRFFSRDHIFFDFQLYRTFIFTKMTHVESQ